MSFDYGDIASTAQSILTDFGQSVTLRSYSTGTYDPATGVSTPVKADTPRVGALFDFGAGQTLERGSLIQTGDKRLLMDASGTVAPTDHLIVGGTEYVIVSLGEINPAGTRVLYDLHLRT